MTKYHHRLIGMIGLALAGTIPAMACAQEAAFMDAPLADDTLQANAGREDTTLLARADQTATVSRNSVGSNSVTGEVRIADNAFQNLSGFSVLNVNTGNNVAINASMNVNISITPAP